MQQLLPNAVRRVLLKNVFKALIELSNCFAILCSNAISEALCSLEKIFLPGFFDVMEHLPIHLVYELRNVGQVLYRWMYPIEIYLHILKLFMRNHTHPEALIAKAVLIEECMIFCSRYLDDNVETRLSRPIRKNEIGNYFGSTVGKIIQLRLDLITLTQAHRYILGNIDSVAPFIE